MTQLTKKQKAVQYFGGTGLFILYILILPSVGRNFNFIDYDGLATTFLAICVITIALLLITKMKYVAYGFTTGALSVIMLVAIFFIEITIHPPDEE